MDRKGFLKSLGVAAAALMARPAVKAVVPVQEAVPQPDPLPVQVRPEPRTVARPSEGSLTR